MGGPKKVAAAILILLTAALLSWSAAWARAPQPEQLASGQNPAPAAGASLRGTTEVVLHPDGLNAALMQDAQMVEYEPTVRKGSDGALATRKAPGQHRSVMRWDLQEGGIPAGAQIESAMLAMYSNYRERDLQVNVSIYEVLAPWDEATVTWQEASAGTVWDSVGCGTAGQDRGASSVVTTAIMPGAVPGWHQWNITGLVQYWVNDPLANHGMLFLADGGLSRIDWRSSEAGLPFSPKLTIRYTIAEATATTAATATPTTTSSPQGSPTPSLIPTVTRTPSGDWIDAGSAVPVTCMTYPGWQVNGDTRGKPNHVTYYGGVQWAYGGGEDVYVIDKAVEGDLRVHVDSLTGADLDVFLLFGPNPADVLDHGDYEFTQRGLTPGTYYVVVDGFEGASGPYRLSLICDGEPTPTATATNTPVHSYYPLLFKVPTPTPSITSTPTITPTPTAAPTVEPYYQAVNCGASDWYNSYSNDKLFEEGSWGWVGGQAGFITGTAVAIDDTEDDPLYQWNRYGMEAYRFTVPNGRYKVTLHFAENASWRVKKGERVFSVLLEGERRLDHYDVLAEGAKYVAYQFDYETDVADGLLDIAFEAHSQYYGAFVAGIKVERIG